MIEGSGAVSGSRARSVPVTNGFYGSLSGSATLYVRAEFVNESSSSSSIGKTLGLENSKRKIYASKNASKMRCRLFCVVQFVQKPNFLSLTHCPVYCTLHMYIYDSSYYTSRNFNTIGEFIGN